MKALIILKNAGGTGKTQTLSILAELLNVDGKEVSRDNHSNDKDFVAMIEYHGSKVGIITIGDPGTEAVSYTHLRAHET